MGVDDGKQGDKNEGNEGTVSKEDFDKVTGERDKLQKDIDDARAEIFTPEYMAFLDSKDKPPKDKDDKPKDDSISDETLEKMSKKDILELATKTAVKQVRAELDADKENRTKQSKEATAREIKRFAANHSDYEKFRPVMYGLSLKKENMDLNLQELYDKAKVYSKSLIEEPTEEEKKKQEKMGGGMKPENSSGTYTFDKPIDGDAAAKEAAAETAEKLGPLPPA